MVGERETWVSVRHYVSDVTDGVAVLHVHKRRTGQEEPMDARDDLEEDMIPVEEGSPAGTLSQLLARKTALRRVLLRAEHHRVFLEKCHNEDIIPKGLRLNRDIHFMRGTKNCQTTSKIEDILAKSEKEIRDTLVAHYNDLTSSVTSSLQVLERKLEKKSESNISTRDKKRALSSLYKSEIEESKLRDSLEKTRNDKFKRLTREHPFKDRTHAYN